MKYFVTSSGTGVGKTFVTAGLVRAGVAAGAKVSAIKPVLSGFDLALAAISDTGILLEAMGDPITPESIDRVSPWRFAAPLSPDMAAAKEGKSLSFDAVVTHSADAIAASGDDHLLIEGVGGVMVPLDGRHTVLDWMAAVKIPAIVVVGSYLGSISHTLTAMAALKARKVPVAHMVLNDSGTGDVALDDTRATLSRFLPETKIATLPRVKSRAGADGDFANLWTQTFI